MEADQAVKFIERMFSHAASDRMAILAIPRSEGKAEQRVFTLGTGDFAEGAGLAAALECA